MLGLVNNIFVFLAIALLAALAVYSFWHGIKALLTGVVDSPTMLSPGATKVSESPASYWIQVAFWLLAAGVIGFNVAKWCFAIITA